MSEEAAVPTIAQRNMWRRWRTSSRVGLPWAALSIIAAFVIFAFLGDLLAPHSPVAQNLRLRFLPPAWLAGGDIRYPLGTDNLGRDILSRIIVGARASFVVSLAALGFGSILGSLIGLVAGYRGGRVDAIVMRLADGMMAFPLVLGALLLVTAIGAGIATAFVATLYGVGTANIIAYPFSKKIRARAQTEKELDRIVITAFKAILGGQKGLSLRQTLTGGSPAPAPMTLVKKAAGAA